MGVEENEQASDPVFGFDGVVVEQPAGLLPAGFGVDDAGRAVPPGGGEVQAGQLLFPGPADKVPGFAAAGGLAAGYPGIPGALACRRQSEIAGGEPVEQCDRSPDVAADPDGLGVGGFRAPVPAVEAPEQVPAR